MWCKCNRYTGFFVKLAAVGSKLANVDSPEGQENQDAVIVSQTGNTITINGDIDTLESYEIGGLSAKWVGLAIDTKQETIIGISKDDHAFTETDVQEAERYNLDGGNFVVWIDTENGGESFTLSAEDQSSVTVNIVINDTNI